LTYLGIVDAVDLEKTCDDLQNGGHVAGCGEDLGEAAEEDVELVEDAGPHGGAALQRDGVHVDGQVVQELLHALCRQCPRVVQTLIQNKVLL